MELPVLGAGRVGWGGSRGGGGKGDGNNGKDFEPEPEKIRDLFLAILQALLKRIIYVASNIRTEFIVGTTAIITTLLNQYFQR